MLQLERLLGPWFPRLILASQSGFVKVLIMNLDSYLCPFFANTPLWPNSLLEELAGLSAFEPFVLGAQPSPAKLLLVQESPIVFWWERWVSHVIRVVCWHPTCQSVLGVQSPLPPNRGFQEGQLSASLPLCGTLAPASASPGVSRTLSLLFLLEFLMALHL